MFNKLKFDSRHQFIYLIEFKRKCLNLAEALIMKYTDSPFNSNIWRPVGRMQPL